VTKCVRTTRESRQYEDLILGFNLGVAIKNKSWDISRGMYPGLVSYINNDNQNDESYLSLYLPAKLHEVAAMQMVDEHNHHDYRKANTSESVFDLDIRIPHNQSDSYNDLLENVVEIKSKANNVLAVNGNAITIHVNKTLKEFKNLLPTIIYDSNKVYKHLQKKSYLSNN